MTTPLDALLARADAFRKGRADVERRLILACLGMRDFWHRQALVHLARYSLAVFDDDAALDKAVREFLR